jgi:hypothetical protein
VTQLGHTITHILIFYLLFRPGSVLEGLEMPYDYVGEAFAEVFQLLAETDLFCKKSLYFPIQIIKSSDLLHRFSHLGFFQGLLSKNKCLNVM